MATKSLLLLASHLSLIVAPVMAGEATTTPKFGDLADASAAYQLALVLKAQADAQKTLQGKTNSSPSTSAVSQPVNAAAILRTSQTNGRTYATVLFPDGSVSMLVAGQPDDRGFLITHNSDGDVVLFDASGHVIARTGYTAAAGSAPHQFAGNQGSIPVPLAPVITPAPPTPPPVSQPSGMNR